MNITKIVVKKLCILIMIIVSLMYTSCSNSESKEELTIHTKEILEEVEVISEIDILMRNLLSASDVKSYRESIDKCQKIIKVEKDKMKNKADNIRNKTLKDIALKFEKTFIELEKAVDMQEKKLNDGFVNLEDKNAYLEDFTKRAIDIYNNVYKDSKEIQKFIDNNNLDVEYKYD